MLARNFMTPAELGITSAEHTALVTVLGMMERGEIKALPPDANDSQLYIRWPIKPPTMFNMDSEISIFDCGTAACLLGWARHVSGDEYLFSRGYGSFDHLFYPAKDAIDCRDPVKGAAALRNYLTTGEARWRKVMAA